MFHQIEFRRMTPANVERPEYVFMQRLVIKEGERLAARLKPYVEESADGPVEVADICLEGGSILKAASYSAFRFLDGVKTRKE